MHITGTPQYLESQSVFFHTQFSITDELQARHAGVKAAIVKAHNADRLESVGDYNQALECYKDAVGLLIPMIEGTHTCTEYQSWLCRYTTEIKLKHKSDVYM